MIEQHLIDLHAPIHKPRHPKVQWIQLLYDIVYKPLNQTTPFCNTAHQSWALGDAIHPILYHGKKLSDLGDDIYTHTHTHM